MAIYRPKANLLRNQALQFATVAHGNQVRKGNEHIPYIFHPVDVANEVIYYSGLPVSELEIASVIALLHDTVEDTAVTLEQVREQFGDDVADGVDALTKDETEESASYSKHEETLMALAKLSKAPKYVQAVKLADRVSNLKNFPAMWGREKVNAYLDESSMIARVLSESSEGLHARLLSRIADARVMLSLRG
jgi:(p)ppGpp synthase/HD superfamily hydrolase